MPPIRPSTLTELLDARAAAPPGGSGYTFLVDGEDDELRLDFPELAARARRVARAMLAAGEPGGRALLLYQPGLDFLVAFFACLYARVIAVPAYPPYRPAELRRLQAIVADARPAFVLSTAALLAPIRHGFAREGAGDDIRWVATDTVADAPDGPELHAAVAGDLAFLQYTSGSTGSPRGVMLTHANLLHNAALIHAAVEHGPGDRYVSWLPTFHDMGFMAGVLAPLHAGLPCVQMAPQSFLQRPVRWLRAISRHRGTTSGAPNFAYELCLAKVTDAELAELDLSSWTVAFNGAEPVRADTVRRFAARFAPAGLRPGTIYPCYGLAEATLMVTGSFKGVPAPVARLDPAALAAGRAVAVEGGAEAQALVACGRSLGGQEIAIVDPTTSREVDGDAIGEIWVAGGSVATGYWGRPDESAETFGARIAGADRGPFLRTGDLGFLRGDQLHVAGRLKDLVILRGRNHYPQDLELTVERCHPALRPGCGAAFSVEVEGEERLAVVSEIRPGRESEADAIFAAIRAALAEAHELSPHTVALIAKGAIHKTSSGKIQRRACKRALAGGRLPVVASWTAPSHEPAAGEAAPATSEAEIGAWLVQEIARRAHLPPSAVDPSRPLASHGLDSLAAVELAHAIQVRFGVEVPLADLLGGRSVAATARRIAPMSAASATGALSCGQRALWMLHEVDPTSTAHTLARAVRLRSGADPARLERALAQLVRRHPPLRTRFPVVDGEPLREELPDDPRVFRVAGAAGLGADELAAAIDAEAGAPFDLAEGPVLRVTLFDRGDADPVLLLAVHHIVADFWSLVVLLRELGAIHAALGLGLSVRDEPTEVGYGDFVGWQEQILAGDEGARLRAHWAAALAGDSSPVDLPPDRARARSTAPPAATLAFAIDADTTDGLRRLGAARDATLFGVTLAAWQLLLHRLTGQPQITVGTPTSGRGRAELAGLVGYLVNLVPIRAAFAPGLTVAGLIDQVRDASMAAIANAALPFPLIVEASGARREAGAAPLFRTLFAFQRAQAGDPDAHARLALGLPGARLTAGDLALESLAAPARDAELDLSLAVAEAEGGLIGALEYRRDLFAPETIAAWVDCLRVLVAAMAADPDAAVDRLPLLSAEARDVLAGFARGEDEPREPGTPLHEQIAARAAADPDRPAVLTAGQAWSRGQLDREANRIAHHLRALGVGPESRVALCMARSPRMVAALLAIWKAGAAYVPIDPAYPAERVRFLIDDAGAAAVVTDRHHRGALDGAAQVICLDRDAGAVAAQPASPPAAPSAPGRSAYIIYTSGSTGLPKGVVIEHAQAASLVAWAARAYHADELAAALAATSICFDLSIFEMWVPLCAGGAIVLADNLLAWWSAARAGDAPACTLVNTVPSALAAALEIGPLPAGVRTVNLAGEALEPGLVDALFRAAPATTRLVNLYAPSETTTYSTFTDVRPGQRVTIGRPLGATTTRVLDARGEPAPVGVIGELAIGGPGVARGYWRRPGLTAGRFLPDPAGLAGARTYHTGDRARWRADGQLEFHGRQDHQVKVRGYRIELTEIESQLGQHPSVLEAVVVVRGAGHHARVVGYAVPRAGRSIDAGALTRFLEERLPRFMVPSPIAVVERLPRTASGKVDRARLPEVDAPAPSRRPPTTIEAAVAAVWAEALGVAQVGVDDDLYALGAHSLLAVTVRARLQTRLGVDLPLRQMFDAPTVAAIARAIEGGAGAPATAIPRVARGRKGPPRE